MKKLYFIFSLIFLFSCSPVEEAGDTAKVLNDGVFDPIEFEVVGGLDRGEFLLGGDDDDISIIVKNNTSYSLTHLELIIDKSSSAGVKFYPDDDGESESPGFNATCESVLESGESCTYRLVYPASVSGNHIQNISLKYKTLVEEEVLSKNLTFFAGTAASLVFSDDQVNYTFGVLERTEPTTYTKTLTVVNTGELTAKNISVSKSDSTTSNAYVMKDNTCPTSLRSGETCQFKMEFYPQNWGGSAPDGDNDIVYTSIVRYDYTRDPKGSTSALNVYFDATSTKIQGKIEASGLSNIEFDDLIVGNINQTTIKVTNNGYKEAILNSVDIRDSSNTLVARCIRDGSNALSCRNPSGDITDSTQQLSLASLPFKITDTSNCLTDVSTLGYTRNEDGSLSDMSIRTINPNTLEGAGESCFFTITFHPSVTLTTDGNFNNYRLNMRYDSTWKNSIDMYNDNSVDENDYTITSARYFSAAQLSFSNVEYRGTDYSNQNSASNGVYVFDLGRIPLIASSDYKEALKIRVLNGGASLGEIVSVTDGDPDGNNDITDTSYHINTFYQNVKHSNCDFINANNGQCDILFDLNPLASTKSDSTEAQKEENDNMYDVQNGYPDNYKVFKITYKDGATYNDDMSTRTNQVVELRLKGLLVRKGLLAYSDVEMDDGINQTVYSSDDTRYFHLKLENVGTGGITYINLEGVSSIPGLPDWSPISSTPQLPLRVIDNPNTALVSGVDKDCYDIIDIQGTTGVVADNSGSNAASILNPGEVCSLTYEMKRSSVDKVANSTFSNNDESWRRLFDTTLDTFNSVREFRNIKTGEYEFYFEYYDGDGLADSGTNYTPSVNGHGNMSRTDDYPIVVQTKAKAHLVPDKPSPYVNAFLWRPAITYPAHSPGTNEWGADLPSRSQAASLRDASENSATAPLIYANTHSFTRISSNLSNSYDYNFYGGTFYSGETNTVSFVLYNNGDFPAKNLTYTLSGDSEISLSSDTRPTSLSASSETKLNFDFAPASQGTYTAYLTVNYNDGAKTLTDRDSYTYSDNSRSLNMAIIIEAVPSNNGRLSVTTKKYDVSYDEATDTFTESLQAESNSHSLQVSEYDPNTMVDIESVRGSNIYAKTQFTVTNTGAFTVRDLNFTIKNGMASNVHANTTGGLGYSVVNNQCINNLVPSATCTFEIVHDASISEPVLTTRNGVLTYDVNSSQYYAETFGINFRAVDPAEIGANNISSNNIYDENGEIIQDSFPISLGSYSDSDHPLLSSYPSGTITKTITLNNPKDEKASFLKEYRDFQGNSSATIPGGDFHTIHDSDSIHVKASRSCFYGDDEGSELSTDEWGFNKDTSSVCSLEVTYTYNGDYMGEEIDESENYVQLEYYDSKRASSKSLSIYMTGFVEPNRSTVSDNSLSNVSVSSDGSIYLEWSAFTPNNINWGSIKNYRVYYSELPSSFNDIFQATGVDYVETSSTETNATITGLNNNRFYYLYIVAIRQSPDGEEYISIAPSMDVKEIVVPDDTAIYDYNSRMIIDRYVLPNSSSPVFNDKQSSMALCSSDTRSLRKSGAFVAKSKSLIDYSDYQIIYSDTSNSDYTFDAFPHWLSDPAEDIEPVFSPDFSCSDTSYYQESTNLMYAKECDTCGCNILSKVVGAGDTFPMNTLIYTYDSFTGAARCKVSQDDY